MKQHRMKFGIMVAMISAVSVWAQIAGQAADPATLEKVSVNGRSGGGTVEMVLSRPTVPHVMTLNNPDRLVLDFANTQPGNTQPQRTEVNRGGIREVRIGDDGENPPTTRVVLDLVQPGQYKVVQNQNHITVAPASNQSPGWVSAWLEESQADPPVNADGSVTSRGGGGDLSEAPPAADAPEGKAGNSRSVRDASDTGKDKLTRSGSDPTYGSRTQPLGADADSKTDAASGQGATRSTQPDPPAAPSLNTLPLRALALSPLLGAPTALAASLQVPEESQSDPRAHIQSKNAMLASSQTVLVMAESSSTAGNGVAATTSRPSRRMEDRKLAAPNRGDRDFVIGPGDVLAISVWKEPDISRVLPVRSDGKISLPLVGELQAAGQTPRQLESEISGALRAYIAEPTVAVIVQEIRSRRYNILGQVAKPGSYMLLNSATVLDAIAIAGGFKDFAKKKSIYVLRRTTDGREQRLPFNYKKVIKGTDLDQNIPLRPGDTIVVP